ncbi:lipocalin-like domain-containing protein [Methylocaldum sp. MU1018]|jgi:predicted secreted hydrolase
MANIRGHIVVRIAVALLAVLLCLMLPSTFLRPPERSSPGAAATFPSLAKTLRKIAEKFPGDRSGRPLSFPFDHGAHRDAPAEIWEFTGYMHDPDGYRYGFRLSFTRLGLQPGEPERPSAWAARDAYRGLFEFLDGRRARHRTSERFARAALGMSGYDPGAGLIWLDDWKIRLPSRESPFFALQAEAEGARLDLRLEARKPAVEPPARGFPGAAGGLLRAYLLSRLAISGTLRLDRNRHEVTGQAWLGRSWGKLAPPGGQVTLNRYQVQLDDGREILIFQLRRKDGSAPPLSGGLSIEADGRALPIPENEIRLESGAYGSNVSGARYPAGWIVRLPNLAAELRLSPLVEDQDAARSTRAWSGPVTVSGSGPRGETLSGHGFVESANY